jgi:hypothetical protein
VQNKLVVTMVDSEPPIRRRQLVPSSWHLGDLHHVIQAAFGWLDYHLHQFLIDGLRFGDLEQIGMPELEGEPRGFDETEVRLRDFTLRDRTAFVYEYEFGDGWDTSSSSKSCCDWIRLRGLRAVSTGRVHDAPFHERLPAVPDPTDST